MNRLVILAICSLLIGGIAPCSYSQTRYVGEIVNITLRTGKGTDHKIIEMIRSGQEVEIVEAGEDWTLVRLKSGKEGWVLTRLLTTETPKALLLEKLREEYAALEAKAREPLAEIEKLEAENAQLKKSVAENESALGEMTESYLELKEGSAAYSKLKTEHEAAAKQLEALSQKAGTLEKTVARLERQKVYRWFLSGAGVLLIGIIIGVITRPKRRKTSLY